MIYPFRLPAYLLLLFFFCAAGFGQGTKYEAENGTLTGSVSVLTDLTGFSGTGYVGRFENDGDRVSVSFTLAQGGWYKLHIGYAGPYGDKKNILGINGSTAEVSFPASANMISALNNTNDFLLFARKSISALAEYFRE